MTEVNNNSPQSVLQIDLHRFSDDKATTFHNPPQPEKTPPYNRRLAVGGIAAIATSAALAFGIAHKGNEVIDSVGLDITTSETSLLEHEAKVDEKIKENFRNITNNQQPIVK